MTDAGDGTLSLFHPLISEWFTDTVGTPTEVQARAWPAIARGAHVLVSAPTGTGKTFAAFLWGINQLATGRPVARKGPHPLRLSAEGAEQRHPAQPPRRRSRSWPRCSAARARRFRRYRVLTRSGDTPAGERQQDAPHPPEILITTPESLNLILSSPNAPSDAGRRRHRHPRRDPRGGGTKRGTHLVTAVDRLVRLAGEFQRIALSATVKPLSVVADLVGGFQSGKTARAGEAVYRKRRVQIVHCPMAKDYELRVDLPYPRRPAGERPARSRCSTPWPGNAGGSSRRTAPRSSSSTRGGTRRSSPGSSTRASREPLAWSHHGSLSRELRLVVEQRLKRGELKAIVATSSLELGIDIGSLDQVILVQTPFTVSSAVQRLGRAGHGGASPAGACSIPCTARTSWTPPSRRAASASRTSRRSRPVTCPLDVLAQVIVSMTAVETWKTDELYDFIRTSFPVPHPAAPAVRPRAGHARRQVRGDAAARSLRHGLLRPHRLHGARKGGGPAAPGHERRHDPRPRLLQPARGGFQGPHRRAGRGVRLGAVPGGQLRVRHPGLARSRRSITRTSRSCPWQPRIGMSPFWKAEERNRAFPSLRPHRAGPRGMEREARRARFPGELRRTTAWSPMRPKRQSAFLRRQREATGADLPHRHHLLVEHTRDPDGTGDEGREHRAAHALGRQGEPALRPRPLRRVGGEDSATGPRCSRPTTPSCSSFPRTRSGAGDPLPGASPEAWNDSCASRLEGSGFFGARFRESAGSALLLPRASARRRTPLWLTRQRAKSLFAAVSRYDDFPLLLEAWRTCLQDEFDLANLRMLLDELASGGIRASEVSTPAPSPFCSELLWKQTNSLMYADDTPPGAGGTALRGDLVRELALSPDLRPRLAPSSWRIPGQGLQRTAEGYAPRDSRELLDWVKERLLPRAEWEALLAACARDFGCEREQLLAEIGGKIVERAFGSSSLSCVAAVETVPRIERGLSGDDDAALGGLLPNGCASTDPWRRRSSPPYSECPGNGLDSLLEDLVDEEHRV